MKNFAVLRVAKFASLQGLAGAAAHNARTASAGLDHADNQAPKMGGGLRLVAGSEDAVAAWHERTEALGIRPDSLRRDAVRAVELVMSASPEWFAAANTNEREAWAARSFAWAAKKVGPENVLQAVLHDDEATPHLHILAVPATLKTRGRAGRPSKRARQERAPSGPSWGLSAADLVGSREKLTELQTDYAAQLSDLGIRRGVPRRTTGARHQSAHAYRAAAQAEAELAGEQGRAEAALIVSTAAATAAALTTAYNAIQGSELVYRPASAERLQDGLSAHRKPNGVLPPPEAWSGFTARLRPYTAGLVAFARRWAGLEAREAAVSKRETAAEVREKKLEEAEADILFEIATAQRIVKRQESKEARADEATLLTIKEKRQQRYEQRTR